MNKQIEEINIKLRPSNNQGILHDSRADARTCMEAINICIKKINEIVKIVNKIQTELESALKESGREFFAALDSPRERRYENEHRARHSVAGILRLHRR